LFQSKGLHFKFVGNKTNGTMKMGVNKKALLFWWPKHENRDLGKVAQNCKFV